MVVALFSVAVMWNEVARTPLLLWLAGMLAISGIRARLAADSKSRVPRANAAVLSRRLNQVTAIAVVTGLLWSYFGGFLVPYDNQETRAFTFCVMGGVAATSVSSYTALPAAGRPFLFVTIVPTALSYLIFSQSRAGIGLGLLTLLFFFVLISFLGRTAAGLRDALLSRLRNEHLTAEIEMTCARLAVAVEQAQDASRSKSRFLANMSHEIRTPMNAVLGLASSLREEKLPPSQRVSVGAICDSAEALLRLINEILDFSQIEAGRVTLENAAFSPAHLIQDVVSLISGRAGEKNLRIETHLDPAIPQYLFGDSGRLRQVLLNLLTNAVKFTAEGQVTLIARRVDVSGEDIATVWEVRDTGIGISAASLTTLFQDFAQADESIARRYGGTGLGLAICRRLIEMMGGTIDARSEPGIGSTFGFHLALAQAERPHINPAASAEPEKDLRLALRRLGRKMRVLLVEDNAVNQMVARQMLKGFDVHMDLAHNGLEAVAAADCVVYDLIFMDMRMPEMDGPDATREIRRRAGSASRVPIVALTANAFREDSQACLDAGMDDFMSKPIRKPVFIGAMLRALDQSEAWSRPGSAVQPQTVAG